MVKVVVNSRSKRATSRQSKSEIQPIMKSLNPNMHPYSRSREYVRALNAVKLKKHFASPFVQSFEHADSVTSVYSFRMVKQFISGSSDGIVKIWDCSTGVASATLKAHVGGVRGLTVTKSGNLFSIGEDSMIKGWGPHQALSTMGTSLGRGEHTQNIEKHTSVHETKFICRSITSHWKKEYLATAGERVSLWDPERSVPIADMSVGNVPASANFVCFSPVESDLLCACAGEGLQIYDIRQTSGASQIRLRTRLNSVDMSPMEAFNVVAAGENGEVYLIDIRKTNYVKSIFKGHVAAASCAVFLPHGKQIVSGSWDRTIRIFPIDSGRSEQVYHTKRMAQVTSVGASADSRYIYSGSNDGCVRIWKSNPSEKEGVVSPRERNKLNYQNKLIDRYAEFPGIRRINKHVHLPKHIYNETHKKHEMGQSKRRKEENVRMNRRKFVKEPERKRIIRETK